MSCRDDLLRVIRTIVADRPDPAFWLCEVVERMYRQEMPHSATTIRVELTQRMCINAPNPRDGRGTDVERLERGRYRFLGGISDPSRMQ